MIEFVTGIIVGIFFTTVGLFAWASLPDRHDEE